MTAVLPGSERMRTRTADVRGACIHVRVPRGARPSRGEPVVLVHGVGVSSRYMIPLASVLAPRVEVLAPDLPGFGRSSRARHALSLDELADALAAWMDAEGIARAALLGNSMGCQTVVRFALRHRGRLSRAVLQGPTGDPQQSVLQTIARWIAVGPREPPALNAVLAMDYADCGLRRILGTWRHALADEMEAHLPLVSCPVLVVRGSRDLIVTQRWAERVAQLLPRGRLAVIPGGAHALVYSAPLELARVVRPFLDEDVAP